METKLVVPESTFVSDFGKLINNPELSDVTFIIEGKEIHCHKIILAGLLSFSFFFRIPSFFWFPLMRFAKKKARSEHFRAMLFNGLRESRESHIQMPDIPLAPFMDCLSYIYTGEVSIKNPDHAIEIIGLANYFKLERLKALCESVIKPCIEIENAAYILQVASRHDARQLKAICMHFIMENYDKVSQTKSFDELNRDLLLEVTKTACKFIKWEKPE
jgi:hypothetical protein